MGPGYDARVTRSAYLRVYQPISSLTPAEAEGFAALSDGDDDDAVGVTRSKRWLIRADLPSLEPLPGPPDGAFVRKVDGQVMVCPWRTSLRMLAGLVAFRASIPDEVADAFLPQAEAERAARELDELEEAHPDVRSHIIHTNWHVPLRWFAAFDDADRILTEDRRGLRIRYETRLGAAKQRLERALKVLESSWIDDSVTVALKELIGWVAAFDDEGLLELDYASVAATCTDEDLVDDHSAAEVAACLDALEAGDLVKAASVYADLTERWSGVRAHEVVN